MRAILCALLLVPCLLPGAAAAQASSATAPEIRPEDLRIRLFAFADDSLRGREAGTGGHERAAAFLVRELERLGLQPAGDDGSFYQQVPLVRRGMYVRAPLRLDGAELALWDDYAPFSFGGTAPAPIENAQVVYAGPLDDPGPLAAADLRGRVVLFSSPEGAETVNLPSAEPGSPLADAAAIAVAGIDHLYGQLVDYLRTSSLELEEGSLAEPAPAPLVLLLPDATAERLLGARLAGARPGRRGGTLDGAVEYRTERVLSPNVVAVLPGSDPALRGQYVALGAHSDHDGVRAGPLDHDSLRAFHAQVERLERELGVEQLDAERLQAIRVAARSRPDSVFNGADDDGSGSVALLEIAERFARGQPPRRSLLFVWHTAEEKGLLGARYFTDHPTVPRDSIVAQLNLDMIGRGGADDFPGGGPTYLQLIGSRRLSTELGDLVESVNAEQPRPFDFDYAFDADGHPENYYCRSDHYMYARYGIPIVFFSSGNHIDYHQVTDEPQYIDYDRMAAATRLISDVAARVGSLDHRVVVDRPKPDPTAPCQQ